MDTKTREKKGSWDVFESTYYWIIYFDITNPANTAESITGYSKKIGQREAIDKDYLLKKKIVNLQKNGYLIPQRVNRIEIFIRIGAFIDKRTDPKILTLYPTHYVIPELNHSSIDKKWGAWLKSFYQRVINNLSLEDILPTYRRPNSTDDFLDVTKYNFLTQAHLYTHVAKLYKYGHPPGAIENFINKYKEIKRW